MKQLYAAAESELKDKHMNVPSFRPSDANDQQFHVRINLTLTK